ncbi:hypothetical protein PIB30_011357 [Stylosanthes scabra]|uniref:Uncharacterized protein n=1 Tax=Stylosanthes scabra TaxID=79078 RepID=A0ABU6X431_9FABA|nr:hypothetical protein [Stylosanthes scabra]
MGNPSTWPAYEGDKMIPNPFLRRAGKGRPKSTRYLNEIDRQQMRRPSRCPQRASTSALDHEDPDNRVGAGCGYVAGITPAPDHESIVGRTWGTQ